MHSAISLLVSFLVCHTPHTLALPAPAHLPSTLSLTSSNLTTTSNPSPTPPQPIPNPPSNFLGIQCYNLSPATVNLLTCQPLFARLLHDLGNVYEERDWWNGCRFRAAAEPCTIMLSSATRGDHRVEVSLAEIVVYATEVLQMCRESGTGGANTFRGSWRVVVTRDVIVPAGSHGGLSDG